MPLVKVKTKYQVTLPTSVRERIGVRVGDLLEAKVEKGTITLIPQTLIDRRLAEGLADLKAGRVYGPFKTGADAVRALHRHAKKLKRSRS
jgi:AbrB family looped-hinge helix DNA binding protein